jgi:hypothetical protein
MTTHTELLGQFWLLASELALVTKAAPLNKLNGAWYVRVDDRWEFAVNGHERVVACVRFRHHRGAPITIPPREVYGECNGWPALIGNPQAAAIAGGGAINFESLLAALRSKIEEARR